MISPSLWPLVSLCWLHLSHLLHTVNQHMVSTVWSTLVCLQSLWNVEVMDCNFSIAHTNRSPLSLHCSQDSTTVVHITPTHHLPQVEQVEIIDSNIARLIPSKEDCPVLVHLGEGEVITWRRSLSL